MAPKEKRAEKDVSLRAVMEAHGLTDRDGDGTFDWDFDILREKFLVEEDSDTVDIDTLGALIEVQAAPRLAKELGFGFIDFDAGENIGSKAAMVSHFASALVAAQSLGFDTRGIRLVVDELFWKRMEQRSPSVFAAFVPWSTESYDAGPFVSAGHKAMMRGWEGTDQEFVTARNTMEAWFHEIGHYLHYRRMIEEWGYKDGKEQTSDGFRLAYAACDDWLFEGDVGEDVGPRHEDWGKYPNMEYMARDSMKLYPSTTKQMRKILDGKVEFKSDEDRRDRTALAEHKMRVAEATEIVAEIAKEDDRAGLTKYALMSPAEFVAEVFTKGSLQGYEFDDRVWKAYDLLYGPKVKGG